MFRQNLVHWQSVADCVNEEEEEEEEEEGEEEEEEEEAAEEEEAKKEVSGSTGPQADFPSWEREVIT